MEMVSWHSLMLYDISSVRKVAVTSGIQLCRPRTILGDTERSPNPVFPEFRGRRMGCKCTEDDQTGF